MQIPKIHIITRRQYTLQNFIYYYVVDTWQQQSEISLVQKAVYTIFARDVTEMQLTIL